MSVAVTLADAEGVLDRVRRFHGDIVAMRGEGASWPYTFDDGITEQYTITGTMSVERLDDAVKSAYVWAWAAKEYLKGLAKERGRDPQTIEALVNRTPALQLVVDVGNREKHPVLRDSRSGVFPKLGRPEYVIHQSGLKSLSISSHAVTVEPSDPSAVELSYPVPDESGRVVGDAITLLNSAIGYWEKALASL